MYPIRCLNLIHSIVYFGLLLPIQKPMFYARLWPLASSTLMLYYLLYYAMLSLQNVYEVHFEQLNIRLSLSLSIFVSLTHTFRSHSLAMISNELLDAHF